jgi:hypothetical protein
MTKRLLKISRYKTSVLQGRFEFSAGSEHVSISLEHPRERFLLRALGATLVALFCLYLYFVSASILNVMARREALAQVQNIQGQIGALESRYLTLSDATTPQEGTDLGLSPVNSTQYVYRPGNVGAATIARNAN